MLPSKHLESGTEALPSTSLKRPNQPPLTLEEQIWLEDYGWNEFKALLVENGLDPHSFKHVKRAAHTIRNNGDCYRKLLPRLSEELAEIQIVRQPSIVQDKKEEEVLRATPMDEGHLQQPIDSTTERRPGPEKYAQNGEENANSERKSGLSVFVRSDYQTPCFLVEPDEQEQKKLYVKMVTNSGNYIFIEYEEDDDNGLVSVPKTLQHGRQQEREEQKKSQDKQQARSQVALVTAASSESSGSEEGDRDAEDPLPRGHITSKMRD
ncbi:31de0c2a-1e84-4765-9967-f4c858c88e18 [Sclerotinia trifoliorum]|uniref:31de0c2a-1e84-4765-9967-f4c858c88e18 n=1 Tax=Sclerotinia trifoliorum TaxID=28548 RepID=A0A8H2W1N7_9HELO|nr:31de0c2a-1e84-4765-9967-f4c858c88e18 [Sclerotinia trifoliorum]